ncbi:MAG: DHH family phosphoesterase [Actinomycetes bacterium]|jgi:phosphoesterase RecJ-like protein|nr:DHH family phosphoesterase [Actinomycetes bacterium]
MSCRDAVIAALSELSPDARVLICAHTRPDGDAVGSVLALTSALRARGLHNVRPLLADNADAPCVYSWLAGFDDYCRPDGIDPEIAPIDLFIALDTPDLARLNAAGPLLQAAATSILIDHHPQADSAASYAALTCSDTSAAATGQLLWQIMRDAGWTRGVDVATACYTALMTDTGSFRFSNTDVVALRDAADMVAAGADPADIANRAYGEKPLAALQLEARIMRRAVLLNGGAVVHSYLADADLQELQVPAAWAENLIDLIRTVAPAQVAVLITHAASGPRVSLRSNGSFDVAAVARTFGGGGHRAAAGIAWQDKCATREQILSELLPVLPSLTDLSDLSGLSGMTATSGTTDTPGTN